MGCLEEDRYKYWLGAGFVVLCTVAAIGNAIVIELFILQRKYRATYHLAYLHLALLDCCSALYGAVFRGPSYMFGVETEWQCSSGTYLTLILTHANLTAILPITYDRFIAVVRPIQYKKQVHLKILIFLMACCWIASLIFLAGIMFSLSSAGLELSRYEEESCLCRVEEWPNIDEWFIARDVLFMYLPTLINIILYTVIMRCLASSRKRFRSVHGYLILTRVMAIGVVYTLSWLPSAIIGHLPLAQDLNQVSSLLIQLALYLNCFCDPILYTLPNSVFLKLFRNRSNFINEKKTFGSVERQIQKTKAMEAAARRFSSRTYIKQKSADRPPETVITNVSHSGG